MIELEDTFQKRLRSFSHGESELGFTADAHAKLKLKGSGLWALVPLNEANEAVVAALKPGTRVWLRAVVRVERIPVPAVTKMGDTVDLTIRFPDERLALLDVREIALAPLPPVSMTSVDTVLATPAELLGDPRPRAARLEIVLREGFRFARGWDAADQAAGTDRKTTVKIVGLAKGLVLHVPRDTDALDALFGAEVGDTVAFFGRTAPPVEGGARVFVVKRLTVAPPPPAE